MRNVPHPALAPWHKPSAPPATKPPKKAKLKTAGEATLHQYRRHRRHDVWSQGEVADSLKSCVQKLAHIQARVEIAEPFKKGRLRSTRCCQNAAYWYTSSAKGFAAGNGCAARWRSALYWFIENSLQPAAISILGSPDKELSKAFQAIPAATVMALRTGRLSEHALANALDVGVFKLANGKTISVLQRLGADGRETWKAPSRATRRNQSSWRSRVSRPVARHDRRIVGNSRKILRRCRFPIKKSDAPQRAHGGQRGARQHPKSQPSTGGGNLKPAKVVKSPRRRQRNRDS